MALIMITPDHYRKLPWQG